MDGLEKIVKRNRAAVASGVAATGSLVGTATAPAPSGKVRVVRTDDGSTLDTLDSWAEATVHYGQQQKAGVLRFVGVK